jgi:hypothetical protein
MKPACRVSACIGKLVFSFSLSSDTRIASGVYRYRLKAGTYPASNPFSEV